MRKLCKLAAHLSIPLPRKATVHDLDRLGVKIERAEVVLLRETDESFKGKGTRDLASYMLRKMFEGLSEQFEKQDAEAQEKIVNEILKAVSEMPEEQREKLRSELRVEELTGEAVRDALITGSLGAAFAVVVEVAGFSAYIFAVKALAGAAAVVGITLPFAVYTTLTSTIAVLANPLFLVPVGLFLGWWLTSRPPPHDFLGHLTEAEACLEVGGVHGKEDERHEGRVRGFGGSP